MKISEILDQQVNQLCRIVEKYPFEDLAHYQAWSSQHYYLIQHTPRFLHLCCGMIRPNEKELFNEFNQHLKEEMNHDSLIEKDMANFNYELSSFEPFAPTVATIELQEHFIKTYGPIAFLGYGLVLEGMAIKIGGAVAHRIFKAHGKRSSFLDVHSKSDETHYPDGQARIDSYIESPHLRDGFLRNLRTTCFNYGQMIEQCRSVLQGNNLRLKPVPESFA